MRDLKRKQAFHKRVIHIEKAKAGLRAQYAETRMVKRLFGNDLYLLCKECFHPVSK